MGCWWSKGQYMQRVWGANMRAYGGRILFGFSILWNLKILWWVFGVQKILLRIYIIYII